MNGSVGKAVKSAKLSCLLPIVCLILVGCGLCRNEIGYEEVSPDGKLKAVVFGRDCGATTRDTTQISILRKSQPLPDDAGNIFIAKDNLRVRMQWRSNTELLVTYPPETSVKRKPKQ